MGLIQPLLIAVSLAMDAFAVSVCKGLSVKNAGYKQGLLLGLFFGGFQALMPFLGWLLGMQLEAYIVEFDHWVSFVLLGFIGAKMVYESFKNEAQTMADSLPLGQIFVLAIATSIDALAVGVTFAISNTDIVSSVVLIGLVTFGLSFAGVIIGSRFGSKFEKWAELAGGLVLIGIGTKILIEHLFFLG